MSYETPEHGTEHFTNPLNVAIFNEQEWTNFYERSIAYRRAEEQGGIWADQLVDVDGSNAVVVSMSNGSVVVISDAPILKDGSVDAVAPDGPQMTTDTDLSAYTDFDY